MKKFLLDIGKFMVVAGALYACLIMLWVAFIPEKYRQNLPYKRDVGFMYTRMQEVRQVRNVDILIVGSSHAFKDYDVRVFEQYGYSAFILGSSAQTPVQTQVLLKKYLNRLNPKLVIFDVYTDVFALDGLESSVDLILNDHIDRHLLRMALEYNHVKLYNVLLYSFLSNQLNLNKNFKPQREKGPQRYIKGGFAPTTAQYTKRHIRKKKNLKLIPRQLKAFSEIIQMFKHRNLKFILVQTPVTIRRYSSYKENIDVDSFFSVYGPYYNYNVAVPFLQEKHFSDDSHLNESGALEFTRKLMTVIQAGLISNECNQ